LIGCDPGFFKKIIDSFEQQFRIQTPFLWQWKNWRSSHFSFSLAFVLLCGVTLQPAASAGTDRITFGDSIKAVHAAGPQFASGASAILARSELNPTEAEASIDFSVALKLRLRQGPGMAHMAAIHNQPPDRHNLSVFMSGSVSRIGDRLR
jgi:hypothetical protein